MERLPLGHKEDGQRALPRGRNQVSEQLPALVQFLQLRRGNPRRADGPSRGRLHAPTQARHLVPPGPPAPAGRLEPVSGPESGRHPRKPDAAAGRFCVERTLRAIPTYFRRMSMFF